MPFWTNRLVVLPINVKLTHINTVLSVGLPFHVWAPGPNHFNPARLSGDENGSGDRARIEQVLACRQSSFLKILLDRFRHHLIGGRSRGRSHMGDKMGKILITGLGDMQFVARPPRLTLFA
jgi:hypothetical protein